MKPFKPVRQEVNDERVMLVIEGDSIKKTNPALSEGPADYSKDRDTTLGRKCYSSSSHSQT